MKSYHSASALTLGLTKVELKSEVPWSFNELTDNAGNTCLRPSASLLITVNPQTVFVAKEFVQGSCAFNEIAKHELRHAYANQEHAERVADYYQAEISRVMGQTILYGPASELHTKLDDTFKTYWMQRISSDLKNVNQIHAQIDTPAEYAKNDTLCNGEVPLILQAMGYRKKMVR